jgi:hypothetical protein
MIKKMSSWAEAKATFRVDGEAPVLLRDNAAYTGRKLLPAQVSARWIWRDGGWALDRVSVAGDVLKADGTVGRAQTSRDAFERGYGKEEGRWTTDAPQWLIDAVTNHNPGDSE